MNINFGRQTNFFILILMTSMRMQILLSESTNGTIYKLSSAQNVIYSEFLLLNYASRSKLQCVAKCNQIEGCAVFTYNSESKSCRGHSINALSQATSTYEFGSSVYNGQGNASKIFNSILCVE